MPGILESRLKRFGFLCIQADAEEEAYLLNTGRSTTLFVEGRLEPDEEFYYDFYKKTFYERYANRETVYGSHLDALEIIDRVERYFKNRERFLRMKEKRRNDGT